MRPPTLSRPKLRPALAGASLAMCVLTAAVWARSEFRMDQLRTATQVRESTIVCSQGELFLETVDIPTPGFEPGRSVGHALPSQYGPRAINWQFAGLGVGRETNDSPEGPIQYHTYMMPLWMVLVLTSVLPVLSWEALFPRLAEPAAAGSITEG